MRELRRTCEDGHALIWHREWVCPLCEVLETLKREREETEEDWATQMGLRDAGND